MNIENIHSLAEILKRVGLDGNMAGELVQHACFLRPEFALVRQVARDKDLVTCSFRFVRVRQEEYTCSYYEVSLLRPVEVPDIVIGSVHLKDLDKRMAAINWLVDDKQYAEFDLEDEATWKREREIEKVVRDLLELSSGEEGKYFANALKIKHWSNGMGQTFLSNLNSLRAKFEISQRFYFMEEQLISIEEAYRFLLNKWMERQRYLTRKQPVGPVGASAGEDSDVHKRMLPKKRKPVKKN